MSTRDTPPASLLLKEVDWIRSLARILVEDRDLAEDAVQDACVAALQRPPQRSGNLRGWLAQVTRNAIRKRHRGALRRGDRESDVARSESVRSTVDVVVDFSIQHGVTTAVLQLEEPYRETILLRYYKDLPLREIAGLTGVAISTVDWRLNRGQQMLRTALDREHGQDGRSWALALLPFIDAPSTPGLSLGGTALGLSLFGWVATVGVVIGIGYGVRGFLPATGGGPVPASPQPVQPAETLSVAGTPGVDSQDPDTGRHRLVISPREAVDLATPVSSPGTLAVRVLGSDGLPAPDMLVQAWPDDLGGASAWPLGVRSGSDGVATLGGVTPGNYRIEVELGASIQTRVQAGEVTRAILQLPSGPEVQGIVVDEQGEPVAGAEVWVCAGGLEVSIGWRKVSTFTNAATIARSDQQGEFRIPSIGRAQLVGARAPGRAPATPHRVQREARGVHRMRLVLRGKGVEVSGVVRGPDGSAVAGAIVFLDTSSSEEQTPDGATIESRAPLVARRTDAGGRFTFASSRAGTRLMTVCAAGLARWRGDVEIRADGNDPVEVRLERGTRVSGRVTDGSAEGLGGVLVACAGRQWSGQPDLRYSITSRTDDNGRFDIHGVPPGTIWLTADGLELGHFAERFHGESDQHLNVDVVLERGLELRGRVLDERGLAIPGCRVSAVLRNSMRWLQTTTDDKGQFAFTNCQEDLYRIRVTEGGVLLARREFGPSVEETLISVPDDVRPTAAVAGVLLDDAGAALRLTSARLTNWDTGRVLSTQVTDLGGGAFRSSSVPAGMYRVALLSETGDLLELEEPYLLTRDGERDLGLLRLPTTLRYELDFRGLDGGRLLSFAATLTDATGEKVRNWRFEDAEVHMPITIQLPRGDYTLQASAAGRAPLREKLVVAQDQEARVTFELVDGIPLTIRFEPPAGAGSCGNLHLVVKRASGECVLDDTFPPLGIRTPTQFDLNLFLPTGDFVFEVDTSSGHVGRGSFAVDSRTERRGPIRCSLGRLPSLMPSPHQNPGRDSK